MLVAGAIAWTSEDTSGVGWRGGAEGRFEDFEVPRTPSQTVLDVVTHIQRHLDPTLSYRFACRVGMCGSCAMTVNGKARWTCRTHVDKVVEAGALRIGPLANMPVIRDLVADMREFFDKWARAKGQFSPTRTRGDAFARVDPRSAPAAGRCRRVHRRGPATRVRRGQWNRDYLAASLNRAWTLVNDVSTVVSRCGAGSVGRCRMPFVPHADELHRALPEGNFAHALHCRTEARDARRGVRGRRRHMSVPRETGLWLAQRATAVVLAICVVVHLATIIYAVRGGLDAAEVLARTRGNYAWAAFYTVFVLAAAVHGAIGLRAVFAEWLRFRGPAADWTMTVIALVLTITGLRAVAPRVVAPDRTRGLCRLLAVHGCIGLSAWHSRLFPSAHLIPRLSHGDPRGARWANSCAGRAPLSGRRWCSS